LYEVFCLFGPPKVMQSDNGTEFINSMVKKLTAAAGVHHRTTAPWNPQANGLAERTVRTIKAALRKRLEGAMDRWDEALPGVTLATNTKSNSASRTAPFTLFFGRGVNLWEDYTVQELQLYHGPNTEPATDLAQPVEQAEADRLNKQHAEFHENVRKEATQAAGKRRVKRNASKDAKRQLITTDYQPGALAMVWDPSRDSKHETPWLGPYLIHRKSKRGNTYYLRDQRGKVLDTAFPAHRLKFIADTVEQLTTADGDPIPMHDPRSVVRAITKHRDGANGTTEYLTQWADKSEATWQPQATFDDASVLVEYHRHAAPGRDRPSKKRAKAQQGRLLNNDPVGEGPKQARSTRVQPPARNTANKAKGNAKAKATTRRTTRSSSNKRRKR
jgi:hypothetical protein